MWGDRAVKKIVDEVAVCDLLDIGSGAGEHTRVFSEAGFTVTSNDLNKSPYALNNTEGIDLIGNFYDVELPEDHFGVVWACMVLEHQLNPNIFLTRCRDTLREGGVLAITVPPLKHEIVGGHVTLWNAGVLLYQLVRAGFNCSRASVLSYGYNISVLVRKPSEEVIDTILETELVEDKGDIETLAPYFPPQCRSQGFNGKIQSLNW